MSNRFCSLLASGNEMEHLVPAGKQSAEYVWHIPDAVCTTVLDSWWWTRRQSETCTVLLQNKINLRNWCISLVFTVEVVRDFDYSVSEKHFVCIVKAGLEANVSMRTELFCATTQRIVVIPYRSFRTTYRFHLQWWRSFLTTEDGTDKLPEMSVRNYHYTLRVVQTSAVLSYFASDESNHA